MIDNVISDTEEALRAVAKLVEPCRVDKSTKNRIKFGHRVMWVFRDNPSVRDKHQKLQVCHQSLTIAFNCLYSKDVVVISPATEGRNEARPPPYDPQLKELLDWPNRKKSRRDLRERDGAMEESLGLTIDRANRIPVAGPSSPCLLPIPVEDDGSVSSISPHSESFFELPARPTNEAETSVPYDSHETHGHATLSSESASPRISTTTTSLISPLSSAFTASDSLKLSATDDQRLDWFGSVRHSDEGLPESTETSNHAQHLLRAKSDSNIHPHTSYKSINLDTIAGEENTINPESRAMSVGNGAAKKSGRSWLAYQATRSDMGHSMHGDG